MFGKNKKTLINNLGIEKEVAIDILKKNNFKDSIRIEEMTIEEIAFEENATKQAVSKSIQAAINNLKNLLSEG